jgi:hypothetical protein
VADFGNVSAGLPEQVNADCVAALLQTLIVPSSNLRRFGALLDSPLAVEELPMPGVASQSLMAQAQGVVRSTNVGRCRRSLRS